MASASLETAKRLGELPATREAFTAGRISETQAREIASAAGADPSAEEGLLGAARTDSVAVLRERCRRVVAASVPDEVARYEAIRMSRYLRHWVDPDGAVRLDARLTPDAGAAAIAAIEERRDRIFREARRQGRREPYAAYAADALVDLVSDGAAEGAGSRSRGPRATVHVLVDHGALTRGSARGGERCEIPGIGTIPVATARMLASDAILKVLVTDGVDIKAVSHAGRNIPARLRTALEVRDPVCVVPGCGSRRGLQIDHTRPVSEGGATSLSNTGRLCGWHHYLKTHFGYRLSGGPGGWVWRGPTELAGANGVRAPP